MSNLPSVFADIIASDKSLDDDRAFIRRNKVIPIKQGKLLRVKKEHRAVLVRHAELMLHPGKSH